MALFRGYGNVEREKGGKIVARKLRCLVGMSVGERRNGEITVFC